MESEIYFIHVLFSNTINTLLNTYLPDIEQVAGDSEITHQWG